MVWRARSSDLFQHFFRNAIDRFQLRMAQEYEGLNHLVGLVLGEVVWG